MSTLDLFDSGLQPERTHLSWRRTALSIVVGAIVALRVLPATLGDPLWYAPGVLGVVFAGWIWVAGSRRYRAFNTQLASGRMPLPGGAGPLLALAGFTVAFGAVGVVVVVIGAGR